MKTTATAKSVKLNLSVKPAGQLRRTFVTTAMFFNKA